LKGCLVVLLNKIKNREGNCVFEGFGRLYKADNIKMGKHIFIGRNFFIRAAGGVEIGSLYPYLKKCHNTYS